jgi:hypothetical protein
VVNVGRRRQLDDGGKRALGAARETGDGRPASLHGNDAAARRWRATLAASVGCAATRRRGWCMLVARWPSLCLVGVRRAGVVYAATTGGH